MKHDASEALLSMELGRDEGDWQPTPHGLLLGQVLAAHPELVRGRDVLELGGGVGNHTILLVRQGATSVTTTEIHASRSSRTRRNVERNCPAARNIEYRVADWLDTEGQFDVLITNPPFVVSGKQNRRYFIDSLILDTHKRLRPEGEFIFVQSSMADIEKTRRRLEENGYDVEIIGSSEGPFRDYYFEDKAFMREIEDVEGGYEMKAGTYYETLSVVRARLRAWTQPEGAH